MESKRLCEYFGTRNSTFNFILLNIATFGTFYSIWMWNFTNKISNDLDINTNRVLAILALSFGGWSIVFEFIDIELFGFISMLFDITWSIFLIILSFRTKKNLEKYLLERNYRIQLNGFLCFIFPFVYQYYIVYNAEDIAKKIEKFQNSQSGKDISEELEKLNKLKEDGAITDEQFEQAKNKILS